MNIADLLDNPVRPNADGESKPMPWRRVGPAELNQHWPWLSLRLAERFPRRTPQQIISHLAGYFDSNDAWFICNDRAIGLFVIVRHPLEPPHVEEVFCICDAPEELGDWCEDLYEPTGNWIRRLGLRDFHYGRLTDASDAISKRKARAFEYESRKVKIMVMEANRGS